jgi:small subunit ribosomal protein S17
MTEATQETTEQPAKRRVVKVRQGVVVSAKMTKTVIVSVSRRVKHGTYGKYITLRKKFACHDELGVKEGDLVRIEETRRMSKTKRWRVAAKLERGA